MALLFLDFDGVLHPQYDGEPTPGDKLFCHLPRVEAVLREFPTIDIVISSMWRYHFPRDKLRAHFSEDIKHRIISTTLLPERVGDYLSGQREREIVAWLIANGRMSEPWIAIDDATWQFHDYKERLVACPWYEGFDDAAEALLRIKLIELCCS